MGNMTIWHLIIILTAAAIVLGVYFLPTIVANRRQHRNTTAIFAFNLFLGWTFLGWVLAFVWALTRPAAS